MPVFDFSNTTEEKKACECTYTTFQSNENTASAKYPILVLDNTASSGNIIPAECSRTRQSAQHLSLPRKTELYVRIFCGWMPVLSICFAGWGKTTLMSGCLERTHRMDMPCIRSVKLHLAWKKAFRGRWLFTVYDGASVCQQCAF